MYIVMLKYICMFVWLIECLPKGWNEGFWHKYGEITLKHEIPDNGAHIKTDNVTNNLV